MKKTIIFSLFIFSLSFQMTATNIVLSNTGNSNLDGIYRPSAEVNGVISYEKTTESKTFKISRFKFQVSNNAFVLGWIITDSAKNEYFAVNDKSEQVPAQGWDVARAGVGLNVAFDLSFESKKEEKALVFTNETSADVKVFPNPTADFLTVESATDIKSIRLTDVSGKILLTTTEKSLDLAGFTAGTYLLIVQTSERQIVKKIVKR